MPQPTWDGKLDYLLNSRFLGPDFHEHLHHNDDYLEFLVRTVWKLDKVSRIVDFGCGFGYLGLKLLPLLPKGSSYVGVDISDKLLEAGKKLFAGRPYEAEFIRSDVHKVPLEDNAFDVACCHAVLMHVPRPQEVIAEMIRVTRNAGMVITCEANRNAHTALFHIDELNEQESTPLGFFQTLNKGLKAHTGVDYNIGVKIPLLLHKAGLKNVGARISDCVRLLFPPVNTEFKEHLYKGICDEGYGSPKPDEKGKEEWKQHLIRHGISPEDAEKEIQRELDRDFLNNGKSYHTIYPGLLSFSFGTVDKS